MKRFMEGVDRSQSTLFPERLDDYIAEDNPVRAIEVFVDELGLDQLGFDGMQPESTGRPAYHPATLPLIEPPMTLPGFAAGSKQPRRLPCLPARRCKARDS